MQYKIVNSYISKLSLLETLGAKEEIRTSFKNSLTSLLKLTEIEPAIVTDNAEWLNDDYNASERPIDFDTRINVFGQLIQSNTKFRRKMLTDIDFKKTNMGILTDGLYIRRDRDISNISAVAFNEIGFDLLKEVRDVEEVKKILTLCYAELIKIDVEIGKKYKEIKRQHLESNLTYVTSAQLKIMYPLLSYPERINTFGRDNGSFIIYDFVHSLLDTKNDAKYSQDVYDFDNFCELYIYNKSIQQAICIGWGAFHVNRDELKIQSKILRDDKKDKTNYNNQIKSDDFAVAMSISFDFARITMTLLEKQHIGEVISSVWENDFLEYAKKNEIIIL
jgi:aspartate--ammonia ligase